MPEWNKLPREVQEIVVKQATEYTRNSLRCCSMSSKLLVENTKIKSLYYMHIYQGYNGKWLIEMRNEKFYLSLDEKFPTFEMLQEKIDEILKSIDCIKTLVISTPYSTRTVKLQTGEQKLLVEAIELFMNNTTQHETLLAEIEPVYLREIRILNHADGSPKIYEMEQVIFAEKLQVKGPSSIREDQLRKLKAFDVSFENVTCSILEYVKDCILKTSSNLPTFFFGASDSFDLGVGNIFDSISDESMALKIPNSYLNLEVERNKCDETNLTEITGCVRYRAASRSHSCCSVDFWQREQSSLWIVEKLEICYTNMRNPWRIAVERRTCFTRFYEFETFAEFQAKLDMIMKSVDFVKDLIIEFKGSPERINWVARKKKLMITKLFVEGDNTVTSVEELLEQVDSNYLRDVEIQQNKSVAQNMSLFDLPKVQNASRVEIENPYLQDDQLLEMNNVFMNSAGRINRRGVRTVYEGLRNTFITTTGINRFLKKALLTMDTRRIHFDLGKISRNLIQSEMFEGLEVIKVIEYAEGKHWFIEGGSKEHLMNVKTNYQGAFSIFVSLRDNDEPCHC